MNETYSDHRLQVMLRRYLNSQPDYIKEKTKSIAFCSTGQIRQPGYEPATFVLSSGKRAKFWGVTTCHSSWACPKCTAKTMARYSARIACAIDALETLYGQSAVMITFTMPHLRFVSCQDSFNILLKAWRLFSRQGKLAEKVTEYKWKSDVTKTSHFIKSADPFSVFRRDLDARHNIKVYEFTYGKNAWHPHIHGLFWMPTENISKVLDYEESLRERWLHCLKAEAEKYLAQKRPNSKKQNEWYINTIFKKTVENSDSQPLWISKNEKGAVRQKSSWYICGWGADTELTSLHLKKANNGHITPFQMLELADKTKNLNEREKYLMLFTEYAMVTYKKRRVQMSRTGLNKIIDDWIMSEEYIERFKKKDMDKVVEKFHVVVWFNQQQWKEICFLDYTHDISTTILKLARAPDGKTLIEDFLLTVGIDIRSNKKHPHQDFLEEKIFPCKVVA